MLLSYDATTELHPLHSTDSGRRHLTGAAAINDVRGDITKVKNTQKARYLLLQMSAVSTAIARRSPRYFASCTGVFTDGRGQEGHFCDYSYGWVDMI